jgi:integrase
MRSGEALGMRTGDIDRGGETWRYTPRQHKGLWRHKSRTVYLGPQARAILTGWLREDPDEFLFQPREAEAERLAERTRGRRTPLTPSHRARARKAEPERAPGDRYKAPAFCRAVTKACDRVNVPRRYPHQLRHSIGTYLRSEFGPDTAQAVLGHSDIDGALRPA